MLVLTRKNRESIVIGESIVIQILEVSGSKIRIGVAAPEEIRVVRGELKPQDRQPQRGTTDDVGSAAKGGGGGERDRPSLRRPLGARGTIRAGSRDRVPGDTVADLAHRRLLEIQRMQATAAAQAGVAQRPTPVAVVDSSQDNEVAEELAPYRAGAGSATSADRFGVPENRLDNGEAKSKRPRRAEGKMASNSGSGETYWRMVGLNQYRAEWYDAELGWASDRESREVYRSKSAILGDQ